MDEIREERTNYDPLMNLRNLYERYNPPSGDKSELLMDAIMTFFPWGKAVNAIRGARAVAKPAMDITHYPSEWVRGLKKYNPIPHETLKYEGSPEIVKEGIASILKGRTDIDVPWVTTQETVNYMKNQWKKPLMVDSPSMIRAKEAYKPIAAFLRTYEPDKLRQTAYGAGLGLAQSVANKYANPELPRKYYEQMLLNPFEGIARPRE